MQIADLAFQTNGTLFQSFILTPWADLYDLSLGTFHGQMRQNIADNVVLYEWNAANGNISYNQTFANGFITFTVNPVPLTTLQLGSSLWTFVASGATGNQTNVKATLAATLAQLLLDLQASLDVQVLMCSYSVTASSILNVTFNTAGTLGNAYVLTSGVPGALASGTTLSGAGGMLILMAKESEIQSFAGVYYYDIRWETNTALIPIFGGTIVFTEGVTRP